jgi:hypothetical protein
MDHVAGLRARDDAAQVGRGRVLLGGLRHRRHGGEGHEDGERQARSAPPARDEYARIIRTEREVGHVCTWGVSMEGTQQLALHCWKSICGRTVDLTP